MKKKVFENWMGYWKVCGIGPDTINGGFWSQFLTFRGPSIVIYSYNQNQQDALFLKFILV